MLISQSLKHYANLLEGRCCKGSKRGHGTILTPCPHTKSLWHILRIFWPNIISNKNLFERCGTEPMATILMRRRCRWIGHVTCQEASIAKTALHWTQEGLPQDHAMYITIIFCKKSGIFLGESYQTGMGTFTFHFLGIPCLFKIPCP